MIFSVFKKCNSAQVYAEAATTAPFGGTHPEAQLSRRISGAVFASGGLARVQVQPIELPIVEALNKAFVAHPRFRANYGNGVVLKGSFRGSPDALALSEANLFDSSTNEPTVRSLKAPPAAAADSTKGPTQSSPDDHKVVGHTSAEPKALGPDKWPTTVEETVDDILLKMSDESKKRVRTTKNEDLIRFHLGWVMGIRNYYGLWRGNTQLIWSACAKPCHSDTASIIIEAVWRRLQK
jgi:hypothetical protein